MSKTRTKTCAGENKHTHTPWSPNARAGCYMPPIAIRTRPSFDSPRRSSSSSSQATGKEHRDDAALCMDALERDEPPEDSEKKLAGLPILTGLVRPLAAPPSPPCRFRFPFPAILGISHTSGSRISDMDLSRSLEHLPSLEETLHLQASAAVVTQSANAQDARFRMDATQSKNGTFNPANGASITPLICHCCQCRRGKARRPLTACGLP